MYNHSKEQGRVRRWEKTTDFSLANGTVRRIHMVLNSCLQQAVKEHIISYNPCESCHVPKLEKKEMAIIPPEKVGAYLQAAKEYGVLPIFYLELTSGLRRGELLGLQWSDLDQENQLIIVNKQLSKINGELVLTTPKTQNSIRKVAVPKQTMEKKIIVILLTLALLTACETQAPAPPAVETPDIEAAIQRSVDKAIQEKMKEHEKEKDREIAELKAQ